MRILALDTSTRAGSAALVDDDRVVLERRGDPELTHAARLPGELLAVAIDAGVTLADVDVFAIVSGPGSFTGLRVGIATVQGLALVQRRPIAPVSALEALGQIVGQVAQRGQIVAAWMDAHRGDVFSAIYRVGDGAPFAAPRLIELEGPAVGTPAATLSRWTDEGFAVDIFIGDGAELYANVIARGRVLPPPALAGAIGRMAVHRARSGQTVDSGAVQPLYVRRPDAEIARENAPPRRTQGTER
jgi:tRNA threonylcarbamoyladenosine biosynthesis protein TsaB